jgi:hypothetical protein
MLTTVVGMHVIGGEPGEQRAVFGVGADGPGQTGRAALRGGHNGAKSALSSPTSVDVAVSGNGRQAPLAQSAERLHGKEKVYGSIP